MAERKKIALCLEYPLSLRGGVSVLVETLLGGLQQQYDLVLVSPDTAEQLDRHPARRWITQHIAWNPATVSPRTSRQLAEALGKSGAKLAHFHLGGVFGWGNRFQGYCPITYLRAKRVAACSTVHLVVHPLDGFCGPQKPLWFKLALFPIAWTAKLKVLRKLEHEIAVSQHDFLKLRKWYWPQGKKFRQIYHSRLHAGTRPEVDTVREPLILNAGHIAMRKGQLDLAEAFARVAPRHPEWKLCLAGDFTETAVVERIRAIAESRGLKERIELMGPRNDAMKLMQRAEIYVQPSHFEALGLALQEALFCGAAGIGTKVGGIPELIEHEKTGLLVEPKNPAMLAQALETLITKPELRQKFGQAGAKSIIQKGMTEEQMVSNHIELYESILRDQR
jgi:glycosyltransferase involved in cell wall biosynthesis